MGRGGGEGSSIQFLLNCSQGNLFVDSQAAVFPLAAHGSPCCGNHCSGSVKTRNEHGHQTTTCTSNLNDKKKQKSAFGSVRRLLQYCQLPDLKFPLYFEEYLGIFCGISEFLFICSTISFGTLGFRGSLTGKRWCRL